MDSKESSNSLHQEDGGGGSGGNTITASTTVTSIATENCGVAREAGKGLKSRGSMDGEEEVSGYI